MKFLSVLFSALIIFVALSGCSSSDQKQADSVAPTQTTGGEAQPGEKINLKDIDITSDEDKTVVTLSLLSGSRVAGYPESKLTTLPEYEIIQLQQPQRLMIKLNDISFWDYTAKPTWQYSEFVLGLFRVIPANENSLIIYVQLSRSVEYTVEESEGNLILQLTPGSENAASKYFCLSNSFFEYQDGSWPNTVDMTPVLCVDLENKLLISEPFDTEDEANAFKDASNETLQSVLPNNTVYVAELAKDALPDFLSNADYSAAEGKSVAMKQGVLMNTPLFLQNGKYLASAQDGRIAFSRRYSSDVPDIFPLSEKLWILDPNGRTQNIDVPDFYSIDDAAFSPDGRYLCILDVSIDNRVLYVYDFSSGELINLGEEGFGSDTAAFAWSDYNDILYAMTGYESMQMMSCTFASEGTFKIDAVEEVAGSEGRIGVSHGRLFFADKTGYSGKIYEVGTKRREVTQGIDFTVSPDGKTMLVLEASSSDSEEVLTSLKLCDIETGESSYIVQNADITGFCFSQNGGNVYYMDASASDPAGEYSFGLVRYDIATAAKEQIALCNTGDFALSQKSGVIYLIYYINDTNNSFYATYTYDLNN